MKKISFLLILIFLSACERTTDTGEVLKFYGDAKEDIGYSVATGSDGYYIAGQLTEITRNGNQIVSYTPKPGIIKTGFDGNVSWKEYPAGRLRGSFSKIIVLDDGSVAAAGMVTDTTENKTDIYIAHLASDGSLIAQKQVKMTENQTSKDLLQIAGGFLILGTTDAERPVTAEGTGNYAGNTDALVVKTDNNLNIIDASPIGFPYNDTGVAIRPDAGGGYIIAGTTQLSTGNRDIFLWKINSSLAETDTARIGGSNNEIAADLEATNDGYFIAGTVLNASSADSIEIIRMPLVLSQGPLFKRKFGSKNSWTAAAISPYKNGSFVLAGTEGSSSESKMLIFPFDADGQLLYDRVKISGSSGMQVSYDVVSDKDGNVIAVGTNTFGSNSLITLLKFRF